jgi:hypothetical protein
MAGEKAKPRTFVRGFRTYSSGIGYLLLALLLLTRLLLAALLLLTRLLLAALLLLTGLLLAALLATLLLLAGLLVWILIHRSFLSNIGCHFDRSFFIVRVNPRPMHSFHDSFTIHAEAMCLELGLACRVPLATRRTDDGTLYAFVVGWSADSDSGAHLAFRWPSFDRGSDPA